MSILYTKTACPFCRRVLNKFHDLGVDFEVRNIGNENNLQLMMDRGGKKQVPFLVDDESRIVMYETEDILDYLEKKYGNKK